MKKGQTILLLVIQCLQFQNVLILIFAVFFIQNSIFTW